MIRVGREVGRGCLGVQRSPGSGKEAEVAEGLGKRRSPGLLRPFQPVAQGCASCLGSFLGYFFGPSLALLKYLLFCDHIACLIPGALQDH